MSGLDDDDRDADVHRLHSALAEAVPRQSGSSIVHGDYRIDNTILDSHDAATVRAVVDWELSTLGDPVSDAALMRAYRNPAMDLILNLKRMDVRADSAARRVGPPLFDDFFSPARALAVLHGAGVLQDRDHRRRHRLSQADGRRWTTGSDRVGEVIAPLMRSG